MNWDKYSSFYVQDSNSLGELNKLLAGCYSDNKALINSKSVTREELLARLYVDSIDDTKKHILIKHIDEIEPCGTITIYADNKRLLPLEVCLHVSLSPIRSRDISICEIGRLAISPLHRKNINSMLLLFCEAIRHCLAEKVKLLVTQAFAFNCKNFHRLGFQFFKGYENGCYDKEFETTCYPMYVAVVDIYRKFKDLFFISGEIDICMAEHLEYQYEIDPEVLDKII